MQFKFSDGRLSIYLIKLLFPRSQLLSFPTKAHYNLNVNVIKRLEPQQYVDLSSAIKYLFSEFHINIKCPLCGWIEIKHL